MLTCKQTHASTSKHTCFHPHAPVYPHPPTYYLKHENLLHQRKMSIVSGRLWEPNNRIVTFNTLLVWMSISWNDRRSWKNDFCAKKRLYQQLQICFVVVNYDFPRHFIVFSSAQIARSAVLPVTNKTPITPLKKRKKKKKEGKSYE